MTTARTMLAIGWEPELRGILIVIIAVAVLMGSVYLILATNLGARLGFLVTLAALFGWLLLMGPTGGSTASACKGPTRIVEGGARPHRAAGHQRARTRPRCSTTQVDVPDGATLPEESADWSPRQFDRRGLGAARRRRSPEFGQAGLAAGDVRSRRSARSPPASSSRQRVYDTGGERFPKLFGDDRSTSSRSATSRTTSWSRWPRSCHLRTEAGRAPATAEIDDDAPAASTSTWSATSAPAASRRSCSPSAASIIFLTLCWLLHRRDRYARPANRSAQRRRSAGRRGRP